ncbi:PREDICTED: beta-glucuronosyltransferase GlcAT14A-like [Ipomoea nil]|uniref:beta-glucuronosyltransferase GlcAT14A-like n=1 Tax=Ipomoea nil TaxID=35883 RepID=UPI000900E290|nr:PREDICTED: beta-glucuronosyltransferase GlcAT14A-like [Ipomoea nil]XP_019192893.1 PREDICTED: beta-glucuronosyltransferase GlcAT14A-like [Ipomoea nil]XP_019192894.1 PREDICTED: beta-glucuronosyltransferase GlcAT14A-like [Ipomoea nil]XP_019192895.1 PREDICTED: beta-glucuronosyltransferase GlcAT14A-like [Ipomoea nil]
MGSLSMEKKWVFPFVISALICVFLLATFFNMGMISSNFPSRVSLNQTSSYYGEAKIKQPLLPHSPPVPRFAYLVSGSKGDLEKLWRTLLALYHPRNYYVVHLDRESSVEERLELAYRVETESLFVEVRNVHMITRANIITYRGPTMVANTLQACAILLKKFQDWDWFINLSASDYPLVTQDDLLYTFASLKRELNFIEHTSRLGWKEGQRAMPLIVDPGLYKDTKSDIFWVGPGRPLPTSFKLFTGSAWMILSRAFVDYCVEGWENLPRTLLMYYTNFVSSPEGYFQTVICNTPQFIPTVVNHDMHYISWDVPPQQHPHTLTLNDTRRMIRSDAPFARKFNQGDPVLDKIDKKLLGRRNVNFTPGGWCAGYPPCSEIGDPVNLRPGSGAKRLRSLIGKIVLSEKFRKQQCK